MLQLEIKIIQIYRLSNSRPIFLRAHLNHYILAIDRNKIDVRNPHPSQWNYVTLLNEKASYRTST